MSDRLTIGELADATGVPTTTVRFYERRGLIAPEWRSEANYRLYGEASLERLRFIVAAKDAGFALGDVRALLDFADGATPPCREVQELIEQRLARTRAQMERLGEVDRCLSSWLHACKRAEKCGRCEVVDRLHAREKPDRKKSRNRA
jgi:MerR family mercuric resistance operon transcriptional regulator